MEDRLNVIGNALEAIYNTAVSNEQRSAASQVIESVKELSPNDVEQIAYALISKKDLILARTGWNFLEHIIKFKWLEINDQSRLTIRYTCFAAMKSEAMMRNELRCAAARCVVLMIEHEWPQNWPELFDQLEDIASVSTTHAQIPFITLQLLVENVITLVTVENISRRKDLNNAIASHIPRILHFIRYALRECSVESTDESYSLVRSALDLFGELVEWLPANVLEPYINHLLYTVCSFLETPQYCIYEVAAKCLWRIASRKQAKNEENLVVFALFGDIPMRSILRAANQAASVGPENVQHYRFLKTLCNVLSALGIHLADVWTQRPPNFGMYLAAIEAFFTHPSVYLRNEAVAVFASLINHEKIGEDEMFNECICRVIISTPTLLEKVGYPSQNNHETCHFSQHDYDDDNDFSHAFIQFRDRCLKVIRSCCSEKHINMLISIVDKWFISRCLDHSDLVRESEWDAMQRFSKLVLWECHNKKLLKPHNYKRLSSLFDGMLALLANCTSPLLMNNLLSMLSTLLVTIGKYPQLLISLLSQLRRPLTDNVDDDIDDKSVKRHCIALLLRIVTIFADDIKEQAGTILEFCISIRPFLSLMQLASCMQVIAALSNLCIDFATQNNFLSNAVSDSLCYFLQTEIQEVLQSDLAFLTFFGFTSPAPVNIAEATESSFMLSRRKFRAHLSTLEGIMSQTQSVAPPFHPAYSAFRPVLPTVFLLVKRLNSLYDPKNASVIHMSYGSLSIFDITISERQQLLTPIESCISSTARILSDDPGTHARAFIFDVTEKVQTLIGYFASKAATQLFSDPEISSWALFLSCHLTFIPDFRLRFWLRRTWKPFLCSCPEVAYHCVRQLLLVVIEELSKRLQNRWKQLAASECAEDGEPSQEQLLAEHMACILTRECSILLRDLFGISDASDKIEEGSCIKNCFLKDEEVIGKMIECMFLCLTYRDATSVVRIIPVCKNVVENLNERCSEEIAVFMFVQSIQSLQIHGSDELALTHLLSLVFFIYSSLRERFSRLSQLLQQVPGCSVEDVERLDRRIESMKSNKDFGNEKMKRESMKKLLRTVIATSVGEQHRRPVHLRSLPPIPRRKERSEEDFTDFGLVFGDI
ncbi:Exportin 1-like family protein [Acanthocheilonema viteae]